MSRSTTGQRRASVRTTDDDRDDNDDRNTMTTMTTIVEISFGLVDIQQSKTTAKTMGTAKEEEGVAAC